MKMAVNKVVYNTEDGEQTLIDLTEDTVTADTLAEGVTAHSASGEVIVGTMASGTPLAEPKEVNFWDYDGTCLYSYTLAEIQNLTVLPSLPSHDGLICQGWNWTLAEIKALGRGVEVGANYITDDGKTRLYITLAAEGRTTVPLHIYQTASNGVEIDWGDGATETITGTGNVNTSHTYASIGSYVISLAVSTGAMLLGNSASYCIIGSTDVTANPYLSALKKVEIGASMPRANPGGFYSCYAMETITIPNSLGNVLANSFAGCNALKCVNLPKGIQNIYSTAFHNCHSLQTITMPSEVLLLGGYFVSNCYVLERVTIPSCPKIDTYAFYNCKSLSSVAVPSAVSSIGDTAFNSCNSAAVFDFTHHTAVPTLASVNAFTGIASDCKIKVPAALYNEWIAATNWTTYADRIVGV